MNQRRLLEAPLVLQLRQHGKAEEARTLLVELAEASPQDGQIQYQTAWVPANVGCEREAVPYYLRALENGLQGEDRRGVLLGFSSTSRTLSEYQQAEETLRQGMMEFPDDRALQVFLAMALDNTQQYAEAMELLLRNVAETTTDPSIAPYKQAILQEAPELGRVWASSSLTPSRDESLQRSTSPRKRQLSS